MASSSWQWRNPKFWILKTRTTFFGTVRTKSRPSFQKGVWCALKASSSTYLYTKITVFQLAIQRCTSQPLVRFPRRVIGAVRHRTTSYDGSYQVVRIYLPHIFTPITVFQLEIQRCRSQPLVRFPRRVIDAIRRRTKPYEGSYKVVRIMIYNRTAPFN